MIDGARMDSEVCVFEPTIPSLTKKGLLMADAVVGNGYGGGVVLVVTNLGTEPAHLEVGEVLGGLLPALAVEDLARPTDMRGAEDFHPKGESIGVDVPSMMQVAAVRTDTGRERVKQLLDALSLDQLEVSMAEREKFQELVEDFTTLFALDNSKLGRTTVASHSIKTGDHPPVKQQPRRVPFSLRRKVCELTQEMLAQGVIVPSPGPWASPIVLVAK